jgi:hypothetical protein
MPRGRRCAAGAPALRTIQSTVVAGRCSCRHGMSSSVITADERVLDVAVSDDSLSVSLRDPRVISVPLVWYPRLLNATPVQRNNWKIAGRGYGIHWPDIDEDLSTEGLLRGAAAPKAHSPANNPPGFPRNSPLPRGSVTAITDN